MGRPHGATVVAADDDVIAVLVVDGPLDRRRPGALQQAYATAEEVLLEDGRDLGILAGEHLLAAHDERHRGSERREHVDELDARHARADDGHALGELLGRVAVARREDAVAVGEHQSGTRGFEPVDTRAQSNPSSSRALGGLDRQRVRAREARDATDQFDTLALEQRRRARSGGAT